MMPKVLFKFFIFLLINSCNNPEARRPISKSSGSFIEASILRNKALFESQKNEIFSVIQNDSSYINSNKGFWYKKNILNNDPNEKTADFGDIINYNYSISNIKGQLIYSKEELKTQNYIMDKEHLFSGLREGLKLMKPDEDFTFIFPSQKAYGYYGDEKKIGINVPIICHVYVNSIIKIN